MIRLAPVLCLAALAGCTAPAYIAGIGQQPEAVPEGPPPIPVEVAPFLPAGISGSVVFQDAAGCYLYSIERTDPPSGFPVRDAAGRQVCAGQPTTLVAPTTPAAQSSAPAPAPAPAVVPLVPVPSDGGAVNSGTAPIANTPAPAPLPVPLPTPVE